MKRIRLSTLLVVFAVLCSPLSRSLAQPICIPAAVGVPGDANKAPAWFPAGAGPSDDDGFFDPRWNGALGLGHDAGEAHFRSLRHQDSGTTYLYVSLRARADIQGSTLSTSDGDLIVLGLSDASGAKAYRISLRLSTTAASAPASPDVIQWDNTAAEFTGRIAVVGFEQWSGTSWDLLETEYTTTPFPAERPMLPSWLTETTRLWVECAGASCVDDGAHWTLQMRIPLGASAVDTSTGVDDSSFAAGLDLSGTMRSFHRLSTYAEVLGEVVVDYVHPQVEVFPGAGSFKVAPDPAEWPQITVDAAASCKGGISMASHSAITTTSATSATTINDPTTFVVRPTNNTGGPVENVHVSAKLRIADWGSAVGDSPDWTDVCTSDPTSATDTPPGSIGDGNDLNLRCSWSPNLCDYIDTGACAGAPPATKYPHQCILAQLSSVAGGPQLFFDRESYWNNMNLREASVVEQTASVSVRGLSALAAGGRDVYLYVETVNMPGALGPDDKPLSQTLDAKLARLLSTGQLDDRELERRMPTYRVHVFHDTGQTRGGARILRAQPSFGFYLHHTGQHYGWKHQLTAAGLIELRPNLFKLSIPNDRVAKVTVHVETIDTVGAGGAGGTGGHEAGSGGSGGSGSTPPPPPPPFPWVWLLVALLLLTLIVFLIRPRK